MKLAKRVSAFLKIKFGGREKRLRSEGWVAGGLMNLASLQKV